MERNKYFKSVLIYCRESRDDGFLNYERIETQRDILVNYCKSKKLGSIIDIIMDDNKSGTDFERLEPIKKRIENNEIDILLAKDASRIGRNILESLTFTAFLEKHNVELIFESERYDEDMFPLIAWFNERRAKDDSVKIRRVLRHKMQEGEIVIKAPFGYIKNSNRLLIDEKTAPIVKQIFMLFLDGYGKYEIAALMNSKNYPTPSQMKHCNGERSRYTYVWNKQHIDRILKHIIYTGDMPYGMRRKVSFKSKKYENIDKGDWLIVSNHHEAIISKQDFTKAQDIMKRNKHAAIRKPINNPFSGLLFCGRCGSRLYRKTARGKSVWYSCGKSEREGVVKNHMNPDFGCYSHRITHSLLIEIINDYIGQLMSGYEFNSDRDEKIKISNEIKLVKNRIDALKIKASEVYGDKLENLLPDYLFSGKIEEITNEINDLSNELAQLENTLKKMKETKSDNSELFNLVEKMQKSEINHQVLNMLFSKIIVFNPCDIDEQLKKQYSISDDEYIYLSENGGVLFIQKFAFKTTVYKQ